MVNSIKRLLRLSGEYKLKMIISIICAIISVAAGLVPYFFISKFLVNIIGGNLLPYNLYMTALGVGIFLIIKSVFFLYSTKLAHKAAYRILRNMRLQLTEKLISLPLGYVLERDSGVIKKVLENDVEELERFLAHNIPETISNCIVPIAVIFYLGFLDWRLTLAIIICIPIAVIFYLLMMRGNKEKMMKYYSAVDNMNAIVVEYINGMKEIKVFNQSEHSFARFKNSIQNYRLYVISWYRLCWPFMSAYFILFQSSLVTVLPIGLYFYVQGTLEISKLTLFVLISLGFATPLIKVTEFADGIALVVNAEHNIHSILLESELWKKENPICPSGNEIRFHNVSFSYNDTENVLCNLSFTVEEGCSFAIVGESGSGKSTIAKLMCRFWDVNYGRIEFGGVDICNINHNELMNRVSFVFQDTFLFNISVGDNIRIGKPEASNEEVIQAAKLAKCHDFIMELERGYDTLAGDAGGRFSGGERQRICIARAILKNSPILILDEATASIDPDCEEQIQEAIGELAKNKTLIVIAHRIQTIMNFDKILVLNEGKICASGTHDELLEKSTEYQKIFQAYIDTENWTIGIDRKEDKC